MNALGRSWLSPSLCIGEVMHARTQPVRNVFRYPLFYLRLPLSRLSEIHVSGLSINRRGVCQILNADHGPKDGSDLLIWAKGVLEHHGLQEVTRNGEIVLQTMPRILGYLFNPVSFYFCYDDQQNLRAVICEVSNTFGERHNYLVAHSDHRRIKQYDQLHARKVFHVSPFFPLSGEYAFRFSGTPQAPVAIINYKTDAEAEADAMDGKGMYGLRTWLRGSATPLTPGALRGALLRFPLLTFGVIARIHWQAIRLWVSQSDFFLQTDVAA